MDPSDQVNPDPRRDLPAVGRLIGELEVAAPDLPRWALASAARRVIESARREAVPALEELGARALAEARRLAAPKPRRVVNGTGVVLHTNLGRATLAPGAARAAAQAATAYADLELDLATGRRGNRLEAIAEKLALLSGAEAALAVNNNAAAVLLAVNTLAAGREVIVSRGELVEIGGSFRVPDILERAGVRLVEVGTTNRTHPDDYRRAIGPATGLLLKVHRSNFEQQGFVKEVGLAELVSIGRESDLPVVEDLGSATLVDLRGRGFPEESFAPSRLELGASLVCFSGDKLLGGPQAGLVLGSREKVEALRKNPLARALRLDKMSLAALDWTLAALLEGREEELPVLRQLLEPPDAVERRARELAERVAKAVDGVAVTVEPQPAPVGGGSLPGFVLDSWVVALHPSGSASALAERLRLAPVPVLCRVQEGRVLLDARTLLEGDLDDVEAALRVGG